MKEKNLGSEKTYGISSQLEILENNNFELKKSNLTYGEGENWFYYYQHKTKDLVIYFTNWRRKPNVIVKTNNYYYKNGNWVENVEGNLFKNYNTILKVYKISSVKKLIEFTNNY